MEWGAQSEVREKRETGDRVKERNQRERETTERKEEGEERQGEGESNRERHFDTF